MNKDARIGDYIQRSLGGKFWPLDPRSGEIHIGDIAHALARLARFTGHARGEFALSVAQHSVAVSRACDPADALAGLLHDAAEAYLGELSRPIKYLLEMAPYRDAERRLQAAIYARYGLGPDKPASVAVADDRALAAEVRDLMTPDPDVWDRWIAGIDPLPEPVEPLPPARAEFLFLSRYRELTAGRPDPGLVADGPVA